MDRLTPLDDLFVALERDELPMHIASLMILDGPAPTYDELSDAMAAKLHRIPRYRQRLKEVPLQLGLPVWQDDPHFNLAYHLRHTAVPAPGGHEELRTLAGRLISQRLDIDRPLFRDHNNMMAAVERCDVLTAVESSVGEFENSWSE